METIQCKNIPEEPIIAFLYELHKKGVWGTWYNYEGVSNSVVAAMPDGTPEKVVRAKMRQMIEKGIVDGCSCGCRGDYRLTLDAINNIEVDEQVRDAIYC